MKVFDSRNINTTNFLGPGMFHSSNIRDIYISEKYWGGYDWSDGSNLMNGYNKVNLHVHTNTWNNYSGNKVSILNSLGVKEKDRNNFNILVY